jgi:succinate dehydrogenase / fumarate reductase iron-sulfur subunit
MFANDCYLISSRSKVQDKMIRKEYADHFARGCSKSLACLDVCPMEISTLTSMAKMNRRV